MAAKPVVYYENWVLKKEGVRTWISYWAVIRGKWMQFYEKGYDNGSQIELRKTLELTKNVQCSLVKRNKKRFPFALNNGLGTYYIKCESELERYHWIISILSASMKKPKPELPSKVSISMAEMVAFKKIKTKDDSTPKSSPTKIPTAAADIHNKRRQKYAIRSENRQKRKAAKLAKNLGLNSENSSSTDTHQISKTDSLAELRRTKNVKFDNHSELKRPRSLEISREMKTKSTVPDLAKDFRKDCNIRERPSSVVKVQAMMHSSSKNFPTGDNNFGYEDEENIDDIETYPRLPVTLSDDHLLPNMIITEFSESESEEDSVNTAETSLNSHGSFLLSSNASHTFISTGDDDEYEQHGSDGRIVASPALFRKKDDLSVGPPNDMFRLNSPGSKLAPKNHLTPNRSRPTTPTSPARFSRFMMNEATFSTA